MDFGSRRIRKEDFHGSTKWNSCWRTQAQEYGPASVLLWFFSLLTSPGRLGNPIHQHKTAMVDVI
jgi:hypothetical protein